MTEKYEAVTFTAVRKKNTGYNWLITVISITLESPRPSPTPINVEAVNYETLLPDISPILFLFEN